MSNNWIKDKFRQSANRKRETGSATNKNYKLKLKGINYQVLLKQRENPTKYKGSLAAFQPAAAKPGSYNETIRIKSYTGDINITIQLPQSPGPNGEYGYVNIIGVSKASVPTRGEYKELTDRQIRNRMLKVAEKVISTYRSNNYYVNGDIVSELELLGDLVGELTIAYKEEIR